MDNKTIDINESTIKKLVASLRPEDPEIRKQVDIGYSYDGKTILLFEIRPNWMDTTKKEHINFAKIRYYKSKKMWQLYWMSGNLKWVIYKPFPDSTHLDKIIDSIKNDENACFFG
jgi:hypothetical protein